MSDLEANQKGAAATENGFERGVAGDLARIVAQADETNLTLPSGYFSVPRSIRSLLRVH